MSTAVHQELRTLLRSHKLRATSSRLGVLSVLHDHAGPLTHESVMERLGEGMFDRASVWRVLSDLSDRGLVRRMDLGDHVWRFELLDACRAVEDDHAHFLCEGCGAVQCLPPLEIRAKDGSLPAFLQGSGVRIRLAGQCTGCRA